MGGVHVDDNGLEHVRITGERYSAGKLSHAELIQAAGDTALVTPASGTRIRLVWASVIPSSDNSNANLAKLRFGSNDPIYVAYAMAHWEVMDGAVDEVLYINLASAEPVAVTVHYKVLT